MLYTVKASYRSGSMLVAAVSRAFSSSASARAEKLVILGSGWGGYEVLRRVDKLKYDVTVVSPVNYFNFTPLLASAAVGTIEFRCATEAVRRYSPNINYYQAWVDSIDFKSKTLECMPATPPPPFSHEVAGKPTNVASMASSSPTTLIPPAPAPGKAFRLPYDKLVISVGAYAQTFGIPGVKEHALFLKDVKDARLIRSRIMECFEQANQPFITDAQRDQLLHFCIVGGGPTGVEFAAELHDLIQTDLRKAFPQLAPHARLSVYDVAPQILGSFDAKLAKYAERSFAREGINLKTNHHVEGVEAGKLHVKEQGVIPFGLLVWSTGLAPNPLVAAINTMKKDEKTKSLVTDKYLNVMCPNGITPDKDVWAIGDAAKSEGAILPATAQVASQKAKYVSNALNALAKGKSSPKPFEFNNQGALAYLGNMTAIVDRSQASSGPKKSGTGVFAWLFWRSAYFTRTVSVRNKFLIMAYWTMTMIFGRDLTKF